MGIMASVEAMVHLPTYVALKATYGGAPFKYLGVEDDGKLAYTTDKVVSDRAKFAIESAGDGIVHIRSCYNNRYWVRSSENENWLVAAAKDPEDDKTVWNCTLFRAKVSNDGKTVKFVHVQLGKTVGRRDVAPDREMYLCLEPVATTEDVSSVVDYGTIVILPQYVAFKDQDGLYLNINKKNEVFPCVTFSSDDIGQEGNSFEIFNTHDGLIYLKSDAGNCWESSIYETISSYIPNMSNEIICNLDYKDQGDNPTDPDILFSVYRVDKGIVALRHMHSQKFLERKVAKTHFTMVEYIGLRTTSNTITSECRLQVVEPILARELNVFHFHVERARIYGRKHLVLAEQVTENSSGYDNEATLQFMISTTTTSTWNTSKSGSVTTKATVNGGVPFIANGSLEIGAEVSIQCDTGKSVSETVEVQSSYTVKVPPNTKVTVTAFATQGTCDVPYSYDQVDHMPNGDIKTTTLSDGVYTGVNAYHFDYHIKYESLLPAGASDRP